MEENKVNIEVVSIDDLVQDDHNFNKGNEQGAELLERSFRECGAGRSVLIDKDNRLVGGNKAQKGFKAAGKKKVIIVDSDADTLVAVRRKDVSLDSAEGRKMAYLDNLTTQVNLTWDQTELQAVQADVEGFDIADFGFDIEDLPQVTFPTAGQSEGKTETQTEVKEDDFDPDAHYETKVKAGEVWQLGEHRLMCGDSTDADAVAKLMNGERADIAFTSPPYGVNNGDIRSHQEKGNHDSSAKNFYKDHDDNQSTWPRLIEESWQRMHEHTDQQFINIQMLADNKRELIRWYARHADNIVDMLIWDKGHAAPNIHPNIVSNNFEFIFVFGEDNANRTLKHGNFRGTYGAIVRVGVGQNEYADIHKAVFPVALPGEILNINGNAKSVLDLFGGTGTTMIAAEQLGRKCFMMELDPHYCTVIIARWEKLTGQKAVKLNP
jgi:DNA modification methylase